MGRRYSAPFRVSGCTKDTETQNISEAKWTLIKERPITPPTTMRRPRLFVGVLFALALLEGCGQAPAPKKSAIAPPPAGASNRFHIALEEGFYSNREVIVEVDGREIYRGAPKTNPVIGLAEGFSTASASPQPVLTVKIPRQQIKWSKQIDLTLGASVGISLTTNGLDLRQANGLGYE